MKKKSREAISPVGLLIKSYLQKLILLVFWYMLTLTTVSLVAINLFKSLGTADSEAISIPAILLVATIALCIEGIRRRRGVTDPSAYAIFPISLAAFIFYGLLLTQLGFFAALFVLPLYGMCVVSLLQKKNQNFYFSYSLPVPPIDKEVEQINQKEAPPSSIFKIR